MRKLKPCPFCSGDAEVRSDPARCAVWIICTCCCGQSGGFQDCGLPMKALKHRAVDEWNSRWDRRSRAQISSDSIRELVEWLNQDEDNASLLIASLTEDEFKAVRAAFS